MKGGRSEKSGIGEKAVLEKAVLEKVVLRAKAGHGRRSVWTQLTNWMSLVSMEKDVSITARLANVARADFRSSIPS